MKQDSVILEMNDISKTFPGVKALDKVSLCLRNGEVHGLMGENGAGKSTLMKVLLGMYERDSGEIKLFGESINFHNTREAMRYGISMIHQELNLIPEMTISENIFLGREPLKRGVIDYKKMNRDTADILTSLNLKMKPDMKLKELTVAGQQMVEIAKVVSQNSKVLIMDEPTSAISDNEVENLFRIIRSLKEKGVLVIYISHRMEEIYQICDRITVLRDGKHIVTETCQNMNSDQLINAMVGRQLKDFYPRIKTIPGETVLEVNNLSCANTFKDVSFSVKAGEVLGFAGMVGAGRTEVCETVFGIRKKSEGVIKISSKEIKIKSPSDAVKAGLAFVSEDRKEFGLNLIGTVKDNIVLSALKMINSNPIVDDKKLSKIAQESIKMLSIKTPSQNTKVESLSGGNQQKVVLAKWLLMNAKVLILDEPTRGIDIGAKTEIYNLINELTAKGLAIVMISSELPELLGMSDRILVFSEGKMTMEFSKSEATQENIMKYATPKKEVK